jgi:ABC-type glycerol-3-phosphate transport system permease component
MSPVFFDEQNEFIMRTQNVLGQRQPSMVQFVLKTGITRSEKVAAFILLIAACVMIFATYWMLLGDTKQNGTIVDPNGQTIMLSDYVENVKNGYYNE